MKTRNPIIITICGCSLVFGVMMSSLGAIHEDAEPSAAVNQSVPDVADMQLFIVHGGDDRINVARSGRVLHVTLLVWNDIAGQPMPFAPVQITMEAGRGGLLTPPLSHEAACSDELLLLSNPDGIVDFLYHDMDYDDESKDICIQSEHGKTQVVILPGGESHPASDAMSGIGDGVPGSSSAGSTTKEQPLSAGEAAFAGKSQSPEGAQYAATAAAGPDGGDENATGLCVFTPGL